MVEWELEKGEGRPRAGGVYVDRITHTPDGRGVVVLELTPPGVGAKPLVAVLEEGDNARLRPEGGDESEKGGLRLIPGGKGG